MDTVFRVKYLSMFVATVAVAICTAQQPVSTAPSAPVPQQILNAKKVFISNVPGAVFYYARSGEDDPYRPYNQFYSVLKSWGYFELVPTPADADLILEISLTDRPMLTSAMNQGVIHQAYFQITVKDPKTGVVLWWLSERLQVANRVATGEKNYNLAMTSLVNDLKRLMNQFPDMTTDKK